MNANYNEVDSIGGAGRHLEVELTLTEGALLMRCEAVAHNQHGRFPASLLFLEPVIKVESLQSFLDFSELGPLQWTLPAPEPIARHDGLM